MKNLIISSLTIILLSCLSCTAVPRTKNFEVTSTFKGINVKSNIEVTYTVAPKVEIVVTADESVINDVLVTVANSILTIDCKHDNKDKNKNKNKNKEIKVSVKAPAVQIINVSQNAELECSQTLKSDNLVVSVADNAEIKLAGINCNNVAISAEANSEITLGEITCPNIAMGASGNAEITCKTINGKNLAANSSGNAEIEVKNVATASISAGVSGNAEIKLAGRASTSQFSASGNSTINATGLTVNSGTAGASGQATIRCHVIELMQTVSGQGKIKNS